MIRDTLFFRIIQSVYRIIFLLTIAVGSSFADDDYQLVPGVMHLDSKLSGAPLSPEGIVKKAREAGMKIALFADKDSNRVEYGAFPLRNVIRYSKETESISHYGAAKYLDYIENIARQNPDMVILPGTEAVPFYYWEGSPFSIFKIKNFHKNILVFGLNSAKDYRNLPSVSNKKPRDFSAWCILNLWPAALIGAGVFLVFYKKRYTYFIGSSDFKGGKARFRKSGIFLATIGALFFINNFPFCDPRYNQYHGDKGSAPYQYLIDYVNSKGGLTFWSSPDVDTANYKNGPVTFETAPYYHELLNTRDYTGFAVFAEGMKNSGIPGGVWDLVLIKYINGERKKPVWAIGELDYEEGDWMGETQTVFLLKKLTKEDVLAALSDGRVYSVIGNANTPKPALERFQIWDDSSQKWVEMGQTANVKKNTKMRIKLSLPAGQNQIGELKIIREGEVVKAVNVTSLYEGIVEFDYRKPGGMTYYRVDFNGTLISNPIFCSFLIPP